MKKEKILKLLPDGIVKWSPNEKAGENRLMTQIRKTCGTPSLPAFQNCDGRYYKTSETKKKWVKFLKSVPRIEKLNKPHDGRLQ